MSSLHSDISYSTTTSDAYLDENLNENSSFLDEKFISNEADIEVQEDEIPLHLRGDQYDIVLICSEMDEREAILFKEIIERFIVLKDNTRPKICTLNKTEYLQYIQSVFKQWEVAVKRSTYMFIFITENFVVDAWADFQKDGCLQESIDNHLKRWCIVPVHTSPKLQCSYDIPWGLRSFKGLYIHKMLKENKKLEDVKLDDLSKDSLYPFFIKNTTEILNCRLDMKKNRIKHQQYQVEVWKAEEEEKRRLRLQQHLREKEIKSAMVSQRRRVFQEALRKKKSDLLKEIQNMTEEELQSFVVNPGHGQITRRLPNSNIIINIVNPLGVTLGDHNTQNIVQTDRQQEDDESDEEIYIERTPGTEEQLFDPDSTTQHQNTLYNINQRVPEQTSEETYVKSVD